MGVKCNTCPLSSSANSYNVTCFNFEGEHPLEATKIVRKWTEEHPIKTRKDVLLEKFPKALVREDGCPEVCAEFLGICQCHGNVVSCSECWGTEVKE